MAQKRRHETLGKLRPNLLSWFCVTLNYMWSALRAGARLPLPPSSSLPLPAAARPWKVLSLGFPDPSSFSSSAAPVDKSETTTRSSSSSSSRFFLSLQEVEKVLSDVKADNVKVIPLGNACEWTDFMVVATGRSTWHVRNIAQALIYRTKQKQRGAERLLLPSVEGQEAGKWIVIDSGQIIVHALDENAREYYGLERLWSVERSRKEGPNEDLGIAFVKVRRKNNSKKRVLSLE